MKILKDNFYSRNHLRAEGKGRKGHSSYSTMTVPTVATPYCSCFKDKGKLQHWKLLLKTS